MPLQERGMGGWILVLELQRVCRSVAARHEGAEDGRY